MKYFNISLKNNYNQYYELLFLNVYLNFYFLKNKFKFSYVNIIRVKYIKILTNYFFKRIY